MPRILLLLILLWVLYTVLRHFIAKIKSKKAPPKEMPHTEKIVACSQCGLHVPESESQMINGNIHCNNPACTNQR